MHSKGNSPPRGQKFRRRATPDLSSMRMQAFAQILSNQIHILECLHNLAGNVIPTLKTDDAIGSELLESTYKLLDEMEKQH